MLDLIMEIQQALRPLGYEVVGFKESAFNKPLALKLIRWAASTDAAVQINTGFRAEGASQTACGRDEMNPFIKK